MSNDDPFVGFDRIMQAFNGAKALKERDEQHQRETARLVDSLLGILDTMQELEVHCTKLETRGEQHIPRRTVSLLVRRMLDALATIDVTPIEAVGQPLDLNRHVVVAVRYDATVPDDTVIEEASRGYLWTQRLLRRAKVIVSTTQQPLPESNQRLSNQVQAEREEEQP